MSRTKLFISHASEDKKEIADDLAKALSADYDVWYDKYELTLGDSLLAKINQGLAETDYGVVILSHSFFKKNWTQAELDGLFALEEVNRKVILPLWHSITAEEVRAHSPILAGRLGISTSKGVPALVEAITVAVGASDRAASVHRSNSSEGTSFGYEETIVNESDSKRILGSVQGVSLVRDSVDASMKRLREIVLAETADSKLFKFEIAGDKNENLKRTLFIKLPYSRQFLAEYSNICYNSASTSSLRVGVWHIKRDTWGDDLGIEKLCERDFSPEVGVGNGINWISEGQVFQAEELAEYLLELMMQEVEKAYKQNRNG